MAEHHQGHMVRKEGELAVSAEAPLFQSDGKAISTGYSSVMQRDKKLKEKLDFREKFANYLLVYSQIYHQQISKIFEKLLQGQVLNSLPIIRLTLYKSDKPYAFHIAVKYYKSKYDELLSRQKKIGQEVDAKFLLYQQLLTGKQADGVIGHVSGTERAAVDIKEVRQFLEKTDEDFYAPLRTDCLNFMNAMTMYLKNVCEALIDECARQQKTYDSRKEKGFLGKVKGMLSKDKKKRSDSPLSIEFINTDEVRVQLAAIFTRLEEKRKAILSDIESTERSNEEGYVEIQTFLDSIEEDTRAIQSSLNALGGIVAELLKTIEPAIRVVSAIKQSQLEDETTLPDSVSYVSPINGLDVCAEIEERTKESYTLISGMFVLKIQTSPKKQEKAKESRSEKQKNISIIEDLLKAELQRNLSASLLTGQPTGKGKDFFHGSTRGSSRLKDNECDYVAMDDVEEPNRSILSDSSQKNIR